MIALKDADHFWHDGKRNAKADLLIFNCLIHFWHYHISTKLITVASIYRVFIAGDCSWCLCILATLKESFRNLRRISCFIYNVIHNGLRISSMLYLSDFIKIRNILLIRLYWRKRIWISLFKIEYTLIGVVHSFHFGKQFQGIIKVDGNIGIIWTLRTWGNAEILIDILYFFICGFKEFRNLVILAQVVFQDLIHVLTYIFADYLRILFLLKHLIIDNFLTLPFFLRLSSWWEYGIINLVTLSFKFGCFLCNSISNYFIFELLVLVVELVFLDYGSALIFFYWCFNCSNVLLELLWKR